MSRSGLTWCLLVASIAVAACGSTTGPSPLSDVAVARNRWHAERPANYQFELRIDCFCPPEYNEWHRIRVAGNAIVEILNAEDLQAVPADRWSEWYTIDELFDRIIAFTQSDIFGRIEAEYHPGLGFPQIADLIAREGVADAGVRFTIRSFAALE